MAITSQAAFIFIFLALGINQTPHCRDCCGGRAGKASTKITIGLKTTLKYLEKLTIIINIYKIL